MTGCRPPTSISTEAMAAQSSLPSDSPRTSRESFPQSEPSAAVHADEDALGQLLSKAMRQVASSAGCTRTRRVVVRDSFPAQHLYAQSAGASHSSLNRNGSDVDVHGKE